MYKLIALNSLFNIFYSLIMSLKLINECLFYNSPVFCSSIYQSDTGQYFKIIIIFFLGSVFKTCSSLSYIAFSISRFILVSDKNKNLYFFKKFKNIKTKSFSIGFILLSSFFSSFKFFQFKLNRMHFPLQSFPYEINDEVHCNDAFNKRQCKLFTSFKLVDSVINDILFFVFNIIIEFKFFHSGCLSRNQSMSDVAIISLISIRP